jgi:ribosomal protein L24
VRYELFNKGISLAQSIPTALVFLPIKITSTKTMGGIKLRGANFLRRKLPNVHPKDLIKTQRIFTGDQVQVVSGCKDIGKRGKVIEVLKDKNLIVVENVAMQIKHLKPNPFYPKGGRILKETPIHYSRVQLIDPSTEYF